MNQKSKNQLSDIAEYLERQSISNITIISPHLDDAAFSLAEFLTEPGFPPRDIFTIFTEVLPDSDPTWSYASGFDSPNDEYISRRDEDRDVMKLLDISYEHAGVVIDNFTESKAQQLTKTLLNRENVSKQIILLPVGAGRKINKFEELWRRLARIPSGSIPHPDHEIVRDLFHIHLSPLPVSIGYYAEIPYYWANTQKSLFEKLIELGNNEYLSFTIKPDVEKKLSIISKYESQFSRIFGDKFSYQQKVVAIPELLFLPKL